MIKYLQDVEIRADVDMFGRFESFLPSSSGLSPFSVINNLLNVNFNADLFEGEHGTFYLNRANHTGFQAISTITGLQAALDTKQPLLSGTGLVKSTAGAISYITDNSSNWNTAFGWGPHAGLYSLLGHTHTFASLTSKPTTLAGYGITDAAPLSALSGYVQIGTANNITAAHNFTGEITAPGASHSNTYDGTNIYRQYAPSGGNGAVITIANHRVWNGSGGWKAMVLGGNGAFTWDGKNIALEPWVVAGFIPLARTVSAGTGLTGGGPLSSNISLAFDTVFGDARYAVASHTHQTLTRGAGLTGSNYNGSAAASWAIDFGTGTNQVPRGDDSRINNGMTAYGWGDYKLRNLTVNGTAGRITSSAGAQTLAADRTWVLDLTTTGVAASTYRSVTVDAYGRVTAGTNPTTLAGYGITDAASSASLSGYVQIGTANNITADHNFTGSALKMSQHYFHNTYDGSNVYAHYYPSNAGNGATSSYANFRVWDGSGNTLKTLRIGGNGSFVWDGKNVATENWVTAQDRFVSSLTPVSDLNNVINGGVKYWMDSAANKPEGYGSVMTFAGFSSTGNVTNGGWISQIMSGTSGTWYVRLGGGIAGPAANWGSTYQLWTTKQFSQADITNWNTAFGWGNHAGLYSLLGHTHTFASLTSKPTTLAGYGITDAASVTDLSSYVSKTVADNIFASHNFTGTNLSLPGQTFHNLFPSTNLVLLNYYPIVGASVNTFAHFRVWDVYAGTQRVLRIGGDGTFTWAGVNIALENRSISTSAGLSGGGDLSANRTLSIDFGTGFNQVPRGDDSRINNGQTAYSWGNPSGLYVSIGVANNITADHNFTGSALKMSQHYFHNTYDGSNVYAHYYPSNAGNGATSSYANFRVWDGPGNTLKTLRIGGNGSFVWDGKNVATENYVASQGYITSASLVGYATENWVNGNFALYNDGRINNGQTAYNWGNHASYGYITASSSNDLTNKTGYISMWTNNMGYITGINSGNVTGALGYTPMRDDRYITFNGTNYYINSNPNLGSVGGGTVTGSGSNPYLARWTSGSNLTYSRIYDSGAGSIYFSGSDAHGFNTLTAQAGSFVSGIMIGDDWGDKSACAVLQIDSSTQGLLLPRMTRAQRVAISGLINGLMVYQTDTASGQETGFWSYENGAWRRMMYA